MANLQNIIQSFAIGFPSLSTWLHSSTSSELIVDDDAHGCIFVPAGSSQGFTVDNPTGRTFNLIQVDDRLLPAAPGGQCDCAFVYDDSINLLEFKTNTISFNTSTAKKHYVKAEKQLKNTLLRLGLAGVDVLKLASDVETHICFNNSFPRQRANEMNRAMRFANDTGVGLSFENSKTI